METHREEEEKGMAGLEAARGQCRDQEEPRGVRMRCRKGNPTHDGEGWGTPVPLFFLALLGLPLNSYTVSLYSFLRASNDNQLSVTRGQKSEIRVSAELDPSGNSERFHPRPLS